MERLFLLKEKKSNSRNTSQMHHPDCHSTSTTHLTRSSSQLQGGRGESALACPGSLQGRFGSRSAKSMLLVQLAEDASRRRRGCVAKFSQQRSAVPMHARVKVRTRPSVTSPPLRQGVKRAPYCIHVCAASSTFAASNQCSCLPSIPLPTVLCRTAGTKATFVNVKKISVDSTSLFPSACAPCTRIILCYIFTRQTVVPEAAVTQRCERNPKPPKLIQASKT